MFIVYRLKGQSRDSDAIFFIQEILSTKYSYQFFMAIHIWAEACYLSANSDTKQWSTNATPQLDAGQ